jgi:hypothetical protein
MKMAEDKVKKERKKNFSAKEVEVLVDEVEKKTGTYCLRLTGM